MKEYPSYICSKCLLLLGLAVRKLAILLIVAILVLVLIPIFNMRSMIGLERPTENSPVPTGEKSWPAPPDEMSWEELCKIHDCDEFLDKKIEDVKPGARPDPHDENDPNFNAISKALEERPLLFTAPIESRVNESFRVELTIQTVEEIALEVTNDVRTTEILTTVTVDPIVTVRLSALTDAFEITPETPERQRLSDVINTTWTWSLKSLKDGDHQVLASIYSAKDEAEMLVARKEVNVTVSVEKGSRISMVFSWLQESIALLAAIATIIGGLVAYRQMRGKN